MTAIVFLASYLLDLILGDPKKMPHPVKVMGWAIEKGEGPLRKKLKEEIAGIMLSLGLIIITFLLTFIISRFSFEIHKFFGIAVNIILGYTTISVKSLLEGAESVKIQLLRNNLSRARIKLSHIVGRDTNNLSESEVIRATVETTAENTTDGIIAPLFYLALGGAPLAMTYKAVNTLDSMIGYRDERYIKFGRFAAITDELANFIPARICALGMAVSSWFSNLDFKECFRFIAGCGLKPNTSNSTLTEGAVAAALGIKLGGVNYYKGVAVPKTYVGRGEKDIELEDINRASRLAFLTGLIFVASVLFIKVIW